MADQLQPYISSAARQFAPGAFVKTWNPELGCHAVGVTVGVEDPTEANPRVLVKWMHDLSIEYVRSEYLYPETPEAFCIAVARNFHEEVAHKWNKDRCLGQLRQTMDSPWTRNKCGLWCPACGAHIAAPWNFGEGYLPEVCVACGYPDFECRHSDREETEEQTWA